ncbi:hypothetical protein GCM10009814_12420 [Lapillicoccus jejuensis]
MSLLAEPRPDARPAGLLPPVTRTALRRVPEVRWAALSLVLFLAGLVVDLAGGPAWAWGPLLAGCYVAGGWEPLLAGLSALRERTLDVDLLMVVAALGAAAIGQVLDGALLIVIFATSGALEAVATARTEDSVRSLLDLAPETATRVGPDGEESVAVEDLVVGDLVLVRPGERVGADGEVVGGASDVDQATITGEPLPVPKHPGDEVFAGTMNGTGALRVRVGRPAADSVVARIAALVQEASRTKARTQLFVEKVEQRYSVGMVAATVVLFAVPLLLGQALDEALLRAMTFMIVASPCAVVLATMPPLLAAIASAGRRGVLVKSAVVMERLGTTTRVAFDKTGTLTRGTPRVEDVEVLPGAAWSRTRCSPWPPRRSSRASTRSARRSCAPRAGADWSSPRPPASGPRPAAASSPRWTGSRSPSARPRRCSAGVPTPTGRRTATRDAPPPPSRPAAAPRSSSCATAPRPGCSGSWTTCAPRPPTPSPPCAP